MKNTVISNTFLSLMCDFGGIAPRDNSQHFFTAYVCSRFLTTSTAVRSVGFLTEKSTPRRFLQQHRTHFDTFYLQHAFKRITYVKVHHALFQFTKVTAASPCITQVYQTRMTPDSIVLTPGENRNALGLIAVYPRPDERRLSLHDIL